MINLRHRLPTKQDIMQVLGTTLFLVFGWSLRGFFFLAPSFLLNHSLATIVGILSYMMGFALFESLLVMSGLISLCVVLPRSWFREGFAYKGSLVVLVAAFATVKLQNLLTDEMLPRTVLYQGFTITIFGIVLSILLFQFVRPLQSIMLEIVDRMQIFVYLYVTLGIAAIAIVIFRVIW